MKIYKCTKCKRDDGSKEKAKRVIEDIQKIIKERQEELKEAEDKLRVVMKGGKKSG